MKDYLLLKTSLTKSEQLHREKLTLGGTLLDAARRSKTALRQLLKHYLPLPVILAALGLMALSFFLLLDGQKTCFNILFIIGLMTFVMVVGSLAARFSLRRKLRKEIRKADDCLQTVVYLLSDRCLSIFDEDGALYEYLWLDGRNRDIIVAEYSDGLLVTLLFDELVSFFGNGSERFWLPARFLARDEGRALHSRLLSLGRDGVLPYAVHESLALPPVADASEPTPFDRIDLAVPVAALETPPVAGLSDNEQITRLTLFDDALFISLTDSAANGDTVFVPLREIRAVTINDDKCSVDTCGIYDFSVTSDSFSVSRERRETFFRLLAEKSGVTPNASL